MKRFIIGVILASLSAKCGYAQSQDQAAPIQIVQSASRPASGPAYPSKAVRPAAANIPLKVFATPDNPQSAHKIPALPNTAAAPAGTEQGAVTLPGVWQN